MKLKAAAAGVLVFVSGNAFAADFSSCIKLESKGAAGNVHFRNTCNQKMNFRFCVANPKSSFDCRKKGWGGQALSPGETGGIPYYVSDGRGEVHWAACPYPGFAADWAGPGTRYNCK